MKAAVKLKREIERCDREIAAIGSQLPLPPAFLAALGSTDWQIERGLILSQIPIADWPDEWIGELKHRERRGWPCRAYRTIGRSTALVEFFDGFALFTDAANVRERDARANPMRGAQ